MTGRDKYLLEMERFRESKLFFEKYNYFGAFLYEHCSGRKNIKSGKEIVFQLGLKDTRQLRELVKFGRHNGIPIASEGEGYFVALNFQELGPTIEQLENHRDSVSCTISVLKAKFPDELQGELKFTQEGRAA